MSSDAFRSTYEAAAEATLYALRDLAGVEKVVIGYLQLVRGEPVGGGPPDPVIAPSHWAQLLSVPVETVMRVAAQLHSLKALKAATRLHCPNAQAGENDVAFLRDTGPEAVPADADCPICGETHAKDEGLVEVVYEVNRQEEAPDPFAWERLGSPNRLQADFDAMVPDAAQELARAPAPANPAAVIAVQYMLELNGPLVAVPRLPSLVLGEVDRRVAVLATFILLIGGTALVLPTWLAVVMLVVFTLLCIKGFGSPNPQRTGASSLDKLYCRLMVPGGLLVMSWGVAGPDFEVGGEASAKVQFAGQEYLLPFHLKSGETDYPVFGFGLAVLLLGGVVLVVLRRLELRRYTLAPRGQGQPGA